MERQITVRLPRSLARRLQRLAEDRGIRRSQLVREALEAYLGEPVPSPGERPFDRVRDLAGAAYGGPPDLAARHREHLKQVLRGR
jgi:Arc/MetJ-type ribon-helix-helix transcriptional regulator